MTKDSRNRRALRVPEEDVQASQLDPDDLLAVAALEDGGGSYEDSSGGVCPGGGTQCQGVYCEKGYSSKALEV